MTDATIWIARHPAKHTCRLRLYCFPYAGGGTQVYRGFAQSLPVEVELCLIQLPGRERRFREPAFTSVKETVCELLAPMLAETDRPWAFFGHSLGALIAFELTRALREESASSPLHLFVSAHRAPHLPDPTPQIHGLPDSGFIEELKKLNGTPAEVFDHEELLGVMLPQIRADITAAETYAYEPQPPLDCPITAFGGSDDPLVSAEEVVPWSEHTTSDYSYRIFEGDHFFIHTAQGAVVEALRTQLSDLLTRLD